MRGYLLVEEELYGKPSGSFSKRYFISFPFCGLKWFKFEPKELQNKYSIQCLLNGMSGWTFGANIVPDSVELSESFIYNSRIVYPFIVMLKCDGYRTTLRLASEDDAERGLWIKEINELMKMLQYLAVCFKQDSLPNTVIFSAIRENIDDVMAIQDFPLTTKILSIISNNYSISSPHGLMLKSISFSNTQINDSMIKLVNAIIEQAPYLGVISLADNFITSAGITILCSSISKCKYITHVDLSNNVIGDESSDILTATLSQLSALKHLNISRNRITSASVRMLILRLAVQSSKLTYVNFAHNHLGDGIATFMSLLCHNQPSVLQHFDVSYCSISEVGMIELAEGIACCKSLQSMSLRGSFLDHIAMQVLIKSLAQHHQQLLQQQPRKLSEGRKVDEDQGLVLRLGSIIQSCTSTECLSFKALKMSMLYVSDNSKVCGIVLRRRLLFTYLPAATTTSASLPFTSLSSSSSFQLHNNPNNATEDNLHSIAMLRNKLTQSQQQQQSSDTSTPTLSLSHPVVCMHVRLPAFIRNAYELLEELSIHLQCDSAQLLLLSCNGTEYGTGSSSTESRNKNNKNKRNNNIINIAMATDAGMEEMQQQQQQHSRSRTMHNHYNEYMIYFVVFTVRDCAPNRISLRRYHSYAHSFQHVVRKSAHDIMQDMVDNSSIIKDNPYNKNNNNNSNTSTDSTAAASITNNSTNSTTTSNALSTSGGGELSGDGIEVAVIRKIEPHHILHHAERVRTAIDILSTLYTMIQTSHAVLRRLGVRTAYLQYPNPLYRPSQQQQQQRASRKATDSPSSIKKDKKNDRGGNTAAATTTSQPEYIVIHAFICHAASIGRGSSSGGGYNSSSLLHYEDHHHVPTLSPEDVTQVDRYTGGGGSSNQDDDDDDEHFDTSLRMKEPADIIHTTSNSATEQQQQQQLSNTTTSSSIEIDNAITEVQYVEEMAHNTVSREARSTNERLILAVRLLYANKQMNRMQAQFWEGAFGHIKYKSITQAGLKTALNPTKYVYNAVYQRQMLYEAMFQRDVDRLNKLIEQFQPAAAMTMSNNTSNRDSNNFMLFSKHGGSVSMSRQQYKQQQGGAALLLAVRLRSELLGIQRKYLDISSLATKGGARSSVVAAAMMTTNTAMFPTADDTDGTGGGSNTDNSNNYCYSDLGMIEEYLLSCGIQGYSGPEMFSAVELRQKLVSQAVQFAGSAIAAGTSAMIQPRASLLMLTSNQVLDDIPHITRRAVLSNMLISREMIGIEKKLAELRYESESNSAEEDLFRLQEYQQAEHMLNEYRNTKQALKTAIVSRDIEELDQALSLAAYKCYYCENTVEKAIALLNELSSNPCVLLAPVVTALREGSMVKMETAFESVHKYGWEHPAMDAVLCAKIHDRHNQIIEDDTIKGNLIKCCLAIKNGFKTNASEMMQLMRRARALQLDTDPVMSAYFKVISRNVKQYAGVMKQERAIQQLIDQDDVAKLANILAGRGTGKLIMCAPTPFVQEEWLMYLQACCEGARVKASMDAAAAASHYYIINERESGGDVVFTGTLEKAARNEAGVLRGWRQRFFILTNTTLTYYTRARGGEKKGSIRVLGGGVRRMDPSETNGRMHCIELEEGRDIALIDPDLLGEAKKRVYQAKTVEIELMIKRGIRTHSLQLITRMLHYAASLGLTLDFALISEAKACVTALRERNLKRDLRFAARLVPRGQLEDLIGLAEKLSMDPNIPSYRTVLAVTAKSEIDQQLLRARGALELHDTGIFIKAFQSICRHDHTTLTSRQKYQLVALILQHNGHYVLQQTMQGVPANSFTRLIKHALACCSHLFVETEPMDLARLLIAMIVRTSILNSFNIRNSTFALNSANPGAADMRTEKVSSVGVYLEQLSWHSSSNSPFHEISKFKQLRVSSVYTRKGMGITAALIGQNSTRRNKSSSGDKTDNTMTHSINPIMKSLLKYDSPPPINPKLHLEAFAILQVIMGDRVITSLARPVRSNSTSSTISNTVLLSSSSSSSSIANSSGSILRSRAADIPGVVLDMIDAAANRYPIMRNECYFQLIKQLTENPNTISWKRGWLLFTIYLHSFPPSPDALPYVKHYVNACYENAQRIVHYCAMNEVSSSDGSGSNNTRYRRQSSVASLRHISMSNRRISSSAGAIAAVSPQQQQLLFHQQTASSYSEEKLEAEKHMFRVIGYCVKLIGWIEAKQPKQVAITTSTAASVATAPAVLSATKQFSKAFSSAVGGGGGGGTTTTTAVPPTTMSSSSLYIPPPLLSTHSSISAAVIDRIYEQRGLSIEIVVMTGTAYTISMPYGQYDTAASLLSCLYDQLIPEDKYYEQFHHSYQQVESALAEQQISGNDLPSSDNNITEMMGNSGGNNSSGTVITYSGDYLSPEMKTLRMTNLFKGFALYSVNESDYDVNLNNIDIQKIPVQPKHGPLIEWTTDIQWDLLLLHTVEEQRKQLYGVHGGGLHVSGNRLFPYSKTLVLRRKTNTMHEQFSDDYELFGDQVSDRDVTALHALWSAWLSRTDDLSYPLPPDHVRIDLIYAEDTRCMNSKLYNLSDDSYHYLLAMQLALCWVDVEAEEWGDIEHRVTENASISIRPCYQRTPKQLLELLHNSAEKQRREEEEEEEKAIAQQWMAQRTAADAASAAALAKRRKLQTGDDSDDDSSEDYRPPPSEHTESSSEYVSSVEEKDHALTAAVESPLLRPLTRDAIRDEDGLLKNSLNMNSLRQLISLLGVDERHISIEKIIEWMVQFHAIAIAAEVSLTSSKYRYLLKRAYVHYLSGASAFYGCHFSEARLLPTRSIASSNGDGSSSGSVGATRLSTTMGGRGSGFGMNIVSSHLSSRQPFSLLPVDDAASIAESTSIVLEAAEVLIAVSVKYIALLVPDNWLVRFSSPIWDIQDYQIIEDENSDEPPVLALSINGMELALEGPSVYEILDMLETCCLEALGRGYFPYGGDSSNDTVESLSLLAGEAGSNGSNTNMIDASNGQGSIGSVVVPLNDSKSILRKYLQSYPLLPRAPASSSMPALRAERGSYIEAPKSQRDVAARERAEEERMEYEMTRMAAEVQNERHQRQIERGREDMKKYGNSSSGGGGGNSDSDNEVTSDAAKNAAPKKRKNRSVLQTGKTFHEARELTSQERMSSIVCGVPNKVTSRYHTYTIPAVPALIGGVVKMGSNLPQTAAAAAAAQANGGKKNSSITGVSGLDRKKSMHKPEIVASVGMQELQQLPPVKLSWVLDNGVTATPTSSNTTVTSAWTLSKNTMFNTTTTAAVDGISSGVLSSSVLRGRKHASNLLLNNARVEASIVEHSSNQWEAFQLKIDRQERMINTTEDMIVNHTSHYYQDDDDDIAGSEPAATAAPVILDAYVNGLSQLIKKKKKLPPDTSIYAVTTATTTVPQVTNNKVVASTTTTVGYRR